MPHSPRKTPGLETWEVRGVSWRGYTGLFVDLACADCGKKETVMVGKMLPKCKCWGGAANVVQTKGGEA